MKILISGSTGNVGKVLVDKLLELKYEVIELTRNYKKSLELFSEQTLKIDLNLNQDDFTKKIIEYDPEIFIHLASYLTSKDDYESLIKISKTNNLLLRALDSLKHSKSLSFLINTGSFSQFFDNSQKINDAYLYSAAKTADLAFLDYYSKTYGFKYVSIIPYTIYGSIDSNKKIIDLLIDSTKSKNKIKLTAGEQILDFTHIDDLVKFYVRLINNNNNYSNGETLKFGTGIGTSIRDLAHLIEQITGKKTNVAWGYRKYRMNDIMKAVSPKIKDFKFIKLKSGLEEYIKLTETIN